MAAKIIIVASSKGGVGKTTVALGIAGALCNLGKTVFLSDLDLENRCLDLYMGIENASLFNVADVAKGAVAPEKAIIKNKAGLSFLASCEKVALSEDEDEEGAITPGALVKALKDSIAAVNSDFVIFDTGTAHGVPELLAKAFPGAAAIVVASHQAASTRGAENTAAALEALGIKEVRLVVCGYEFREASRGQRSGILEIIDSSKIKLIGAVPYDRNLMLCHERGIKPPVGSPADVAFANIAKRLCGMRVRLFEGITSVNRKKII